jgi:riboflavin kinase / FMN adenylyltransferase
LLIITAFQLQVYLSTADFPKLSCPVVTIGTFDGVHLGHQTILKRLAVLATKFDGQSVVITFHPHPRLVLNPDDTSLELLNTLPERIMRLEKAGVDHLLVIPFNLEFAKLTSLEFITEILVNAVGTKKLVIGYDHHFGRNREGSFEHLSKSGINYGFDVEEIPAKDIDEVAISSTRIRKALHNGDVETASQYLGYQYPFYGKVIRGQRLGHTIGFPTANLELSNDRKLIPGNGVYAVTVEMDEGVFHGMMNIGTRPTVSNENERHVEVHLFNWNGDLYNRELRVNMYARIRDERRFPNVDALKDRLAVDREEAIHILSKL